jgi:predicted DNA-binding transcriptional regulator AlpA
VISRLLSVYELKPEKGINYSPRYIRKLTRLGKFPKPVPLSPGGRRKGYPEDEIDQHIADMIAARDEGVV